MSNNLAERRASSVSANLSSFLVPKSEPIDEELNLNHKRHLNEQMFNNVDGIGSNKRLMATKKQSSDVLIGKMTNGRTIGNNGEGNCSPNSDLPSKPR